MSNEVLAQIMFDSDYAEFEITSPNAFIRAVEGVPDDIVLTDRKLQCSKQSGYQFGIVGDGNPIDIVISHGKGSVEDHSSGGWAQVDFAGNKYVSSDRVDGLSKEFKDCPAISVEMYSMIGRMERYRRAVSMNPGNMPPSGNTVLYVDGI